MNILASIGIQGIMSVLPNMWASIDYRSNEKPPVLSYLNANTALSSGTLSVSQANQSLLVVGNNPIPLTFHIPSPNATRFIATYIALTIHSVFRVPSVSNLVKTVFVCSSPWIGFLKSMNTIMILKIWRLLPDMYIMMAFMGRALAGARASSHDFFILSVSVSSGVGGLRWASCLAAAR